MTKKLNMSNGHGGKITNSHYDVFYGTPIRLRKISTYPIFRPAVSWPVKDTLGRMFILLDSRVENDHIDHSLRRFIAQNNPTLFWVERPLNGRLLDTLIGNSAKAQGRIHAAEQEYADCVEKLCNQREARRLKRLDLNSDEDAFLRNYRRLSKSFYSYEGRRPELIMKVQEAIYVLQRFKSMLAVETDDFDTTKTYHDWQFGASNLLSSHVPNMLYDRQRAVAHGKTIQENQSKFEALEARVKEAAALRGKK